MRVSNSNTPAAIYAEHSASLMPSGKYGIEPSIQPREAGVVCVKHVAHFKEGCFDSCNAGISRQYFQVYEYGYESNFPSVCHIPCTCFSLPPNCLCPGTDNIHKSYFDRGIYDQQDLSHCLGCIRGDATVFAGEIKYLCCCMECCDPCYYLSCKCCCNNGERVRVIPFEIYCCCCSNRATCCTNYCGLCGPKTGEPLLLFNLISRLAPGEADKLARAMNNSRMEWKIHLGK